MASYLKITVLACIEDTMYPTKLWQTFKAK